MDPKCFEKLKFPYLASPKLDGIRAIGWNGVLQSRSGKPIPSVQAQNMFKHLHGLDGELIIGRPTDTNVYNATQSHVMSFNKPGNLHFYVFDRISNDPFCVRLASLPKGDDWLHPVTHTCISNLEMLFNYENGCLEAGYEGIMLRGMEGRYKHGRSTFNDHILFKLKRFVEEEVEVIGFVEQMINNNMAKVNSLGYTERSTCKDGMVPANTLGKFIVNYKKLPLEISCGSFNHDERRCIWFHQEQYLGRTLVMRHFAVGLEGYLPRFPRAVGWRKDGR